MTTKYGDPSLATPRDAASITPAESRSHIGDTPANIATRTRQLRLLRALERRCRWHYERGFTVLVSLYTLHSYNLELAHPLPEYAVTALFARTFDPHGRLAFLAPWRRDPKAPLPCLAPRRSRDMR